MPPFERPSHLRKRAKPDSREQTWSPAADQATLKDEGREDDKDAYELPHTDKTTVPTPTDGLEDEDEVGKKYDRSLLLALNQTVLFRCVRTCSLRECIFTCIASIHFLARQGQAYRHSYLRRAR